MMAPVNRPLASPLHALARSAGIFTLLVGLLELLGWALNMSVFKRALPALVTLQLDTALAFLLAGATLWLLQTSQLKPGRRLICFYATLMLLIGSFTLSGYGFGWNLGIDQLLFQTVPGTAAWHAGRMSLATACNFMLLGLTCLLLNARRGFRIAQGLILAAGFISLLAAIGYLYNLESLYQVGSDNTITLDSALTFLVLCLGLLATQREHGFMAFLASESLGALLARRLVPIALLVPVLFGWLGLQFQHAGLYEAHVALSLATAAHVVVFLAFIWWSANTLNQLDLRGQQAEITLRQTQDELERHIAARTNELRDANMQLQRELAKREQAEQTFRGIWESALEAIVIVNSIGQIVMLNAQAEHLFGYQRSQLVGQLVEALLSPRFRERHGQYPRDYFVTPHTWAIGVGLELYGQRQDGTEFPIEISLSPLQTAEGMLISSTIRDITERKQVQDELQQSEERFRLLVEGVRDYAIFMLDPSGHIVSWNRGAERIKGYQAQEIIGQHFSCFYLAADVQAGKPEQELAIALREREFHEEGARVRKDGSQFIADVMITALFDEGGTLRGFAKVTRDITTHKQVEAALRYSEEKLRSLFNVLPVGVSILDEHNTVSEMNSTLMEILDISQESFIQGTYKIRDYIRPDGRPLTQAELPSTRAIHEGSVHDLEIGIIKENREIIWASVNAVHLPEPQHGVVIVTADITKRKQADEQLRASVREKEALLKEIHHRVTNNLQIISSLLKLQAGTIRDPKTLEIFQESQHRVQSMALVHETLYQSGDLARVNFEQYLRQLIRNLGRSYGAQAAGVEIKLNAKEILLDLDTAISCGLIINELVSNALKHAFPIGRQSGQASQIQIELGEVERQITLAVRDNGVGLPAELSFQRAASLGLQLVYSLTSDELDGTIEVERHNGTCFKLSFPTPTQTLS